MPVVVWVVGGLIAWRAADHTGEAVAERVTAALPYAAAAALAYVAWRGVGRG